ESSESTEYRVARLSNASATAAAAKSDQSTAAAANSALAESAKEFLGCWRSHPAEQPRHFVQHSRHRARDRLYGLFALLSKAAGWPASRGLSLKLRPRAVCEC